MELAKAGVGHIDIFDADFYDPGNAVRHILPVTMAGRQKALQVARFCRELNPFCVARGWSGSLGHRAGDSDEIMALFEDADLVVEATGSHAITRLCRRRASRAGLPVVTAALSVGGYGGRVVVLEPRGPCWDCFLMHQDDEVIPRPPEGPRSEDAPFGCSHPAASCAGFDVTSVAAVASRMAVQAMRRTKYPELDNNWTVLSFRPGRAPVEAGKLTPHSECPIEH